MDELERKERVVALLVPADTNNESEVPDTTETGERVLKDDAARVASRVVRAASLIVPRHNFTGWDARWDRMWRARQIHVRGLK